MLPRFLGVVVSPARLFSRQVVAFLVVGAVGSGIFVLPVTLVVVPPLVWYFIRVRRTFVTTSRELKRIGKQS